MTPRTLNRRERRSSPLPVLPVGVPSAPSQRMTALASCVPILAFWKSRPAGGARLGLARSLAARGLALFPFGLRPAIESAWTRSASPSGQNNHMVALAKLAVGLEGLHERAQPRGRSRQHIDPFLLADHPRVVHHVPVASILGKA